MYSRKVVWVGGVCLGSLSCFLLIFTPGHYPEESTILGENPLKELTPVVWYKKIHKKKLLLLFTSHPLGLHLLVFHSPSEKPRGPPAPSLKDFKNYLLIFCVASSLFKLHPSHSSCLIELGPWRLKFLLFPWFANPDGRSWPDASGSVLRQSKHPSKRKTGSVPAISVPSRRSQYLKEN